MRTVRRVNVSAMSAVATFGVGASILFGLGLVVAIALVWGTVPALVVGLVLSVAGTVWARSVDREQQLDAQPAAPGPGKFRDPEEDADEQGWSPSRPTSWRGPGET